MDVLLRLSPCSAIRHGGALSRAQARCGAPKEGWIDLSTGINPWFWPWPRPLPPLSATTWSRLPDEDAMQEAIKAAKEAYGVGSSATIVAAAGTQALLQVLPFAVASEQDVAAVAIVGPTYAEHALCWGRLAGIRVCEAASLEQAEDDASVVVVVNPNNPDGRALLPDALCAAAERLAHRGGMLVVDEAFVDLCPDLSVAGKVGKTPGLAVLRSFGKFFGLAGLRLGFAVVSASLAARLVALQGPWAVGGPALVYGAAALRDQAWAEETRNRLARKAEKLDALFKSRGLRPVGGTDLFRLVACDNAEERAESLARQGILVRRFSYERTWLRFGLPGDDAAWERLRAAFS